MDWRTLPSLPAGEFRARVIESVAGGRRLLSLFACPPAEGEGGLWLWAVLGDDAQGLVTVLRAVGLGRYPSLTPECPQAHLFEREIHEQWGLVPEGHPWLKPVREPQQEFYRVEGEEVHEVGVGPVHAGVIEPGHFRFQCHGEKVLHLEIALGYQHRGVERALRGGPDARTVHYLETAAGDTTVGHATAGCQVLEALGGGKVPPRAEALRAVALELERLANHVGDMGALAGDVGYLPAASYCGRLRGDFLNLTAAICGSRFGRGLVRPGGVGFDVEPERAAEMLRRLREAVRDTGDAVGLMLDQGIVLERFRGTGAIDAAMARDLGLVGPAARACGLARDVRAQYPWGHYREEPVEPAVADTGDVLGRARVRSLEIGRSCAYVARVLGSLPPGPVHRDLPPPAPFQVAVGLVEGWRGEICHVGLTGADGRLHHYKITDPSFHDWTGLAMALRGQAISDFPLCNKSFNLSYAGHDL